MLEIKTVSMLDMWIVLLYKGVRFDAGHIDSFIYKQGSWI